MAQSRRWLLEAAVFLFLLLSVRFSLAQAPPRTTSPLVLTHMTVVEVRTGRLAPDQTVVIEGDKIASVGASKNAKLAPDARVIDCTGLYLIPGLWDMHVHLEFGDWFPNS